MAGIVVATVVLTVGSAPTVSAEPFGSSSFPGSSGSSGGGPATSPPDPSEHAKWLVEKVDGAGKVGTDTILTAEFTDAAPLQGINVRVSGALSANAVAGITLSKSGLPQVNIQIESTASGIEAGSVQLFRADLPISDPLPIAFASTEFTADEIPSSPSMPSDSRIVTDGVSEFIRDQILVWISDGTAAPDSRAKEIASEFHAVFTGSSPELRMYSFQVQVSTVEELESVRDRIAASAGVELASLNYVSYPDAIKGNGSQYQTSQDSVFKRIQLEPAWKAATGAGVSVGVLDSDIVADHEDLRDNIKESWGLGTLFEGHGTHVSGIICAKGGNNKGITGVAPDCDIRHNSVFMQKRDFWGSRDASKNGLWTTDELVVNRMKNLASDPTVKVINLSLGSSGKSCTAADKKAQEKEIANKARVVKGNRHVLWVFAAGNDSRDAACSNGALAKLIDRSNLLIVGNINADRSQGGDRLARSSNFGDTIDLVAPGIDIDSLWDTCFEIWACNNGYTKLSGTSMSAPHVTGVAALAFDANPNATAAEVRKCIVEGAQNSHDTVGPNASNTADMRESYPVLKADAAIACIDNSAAPSPSDYAAPIRYDLGHHSETLAIADVNHDGRPDTVAPDGNGSTVSVLLGKGDGTFGPKEGFTTGRGPYGVAVVDVDGDGHPDIVTANSNEQSVSVLKGGGDGTFAPKVDYPTGSAPRWVAVKDMNRDGKPDLVVSNYNDGSVSVLLQRSDKTFAPKVDSQVGQTPVTLAVADLNGDGKPDLVSDSAVLLGKGDGTFAPKFDYNFPADRVIITDVNNDGKPDLVATCFDEKVRVLFGRGDGTFGPAAMYSTDGPTPNGLAASDVNGDSLIDIVVTDLNKSSFQVLSGRGDGTFSQPAVSPESESFLVEPQVVDLNGDNRPDVVTGSVISGDEKLFVFLHK